MRKEFVTCKTRRLAKHLCSWAVVIVRAEGGFWCFESPDDYRTWKAQV